MAGHAPSLVITMNSLLSVSEPISVFVPERGLVEGTLWREPGGRGFFAVEYGGSRWYDGQAYSNPDEMIEPAKAVLRKAASEVSARPAAPGGH